MAEHIGGFPDDFNYNSETYGDNGNEYTSSPDWDFVGREVEQFENCSSAFVLNLRKRRPR